MLDYKGPIKALAEASDLKLMGDTILVQKIKEAEDLPKFGGLYIPRGMDRKELNADRGGFFEIILVGEGYYDEATDKTHPLGLSVGNIVLLGGTSVLWYEKYGLLQNYMPFSIGVSRESEVRAIFPSKEKYEAAFSIANGLLSQVVAISNETNISR